MLKYSINPDSDVPIYRQLADQINAQIRSGALKTGTQLPTVREMADKLHLSCGTVKRVYDRLQEMGDIEMTRRRGTFVKYVREDKDSRKVRAMAAIDLMIRQLSDLNFSPAEIQIFLNLKMREWGLKWSGIRIALATDYTELAPSLEEQLSFLGNVRVSTWQLRQLREYPYGMDEESDVILASAADDQLLRPILPDAGKLIRLAFELRPECAYQLGRIEGKIAVVSREPHFFELISAHLPEDCRGRLTDCPAQSVEEAFSVLEEAEAVLAAPKYESYCPPGLVEVLDRLRQEGRLIPFDYRIDEGSMIYLEERINRIREERQLQPGTMQF